ncbi:MAG: hypothetical protein N3A54_05660, partial [Patescibacteria group bacterium]|nr:hypothetical protein [Patescibacteria group bacterium]
VLCEGIQINSEFRSKMLSKIAYSSHKFSSCNNILQSLLGMQNWTTSDGESIQITDLGSDVSLAYQSIVYAVKDSNVRNDNTKAEILKEILSIEDLGSDRSRVLAVVAQAANGLPFKDKNEIIRQLQKLQ